MPSIQIVTVSCFGTSQKASEHCPSMEIVMASHSKINLPSLRLIPSKSPIEFLQMCLKSAHSG